MNNKKNSMEDFVDKAIQNNDFSQVSDIIEKSVITAIDLTRTGANAFFSGIQKSMNKKDQRLPINKDPRFVRQKTASHKAYMWLRNITLVGSGFMGLVSIDAFFSLIVRFGSGALLGTLMALGLTGGGLVVTKFFHQKMKLEKNFSRYRIEVADNRVVAVDDFATAVAQPHHVVVNELQKLISDGYFPQGRLVEDGQLFLLDQGAYKAYKENYRQASVHVKETPKSIQEGEENQALDQRRVAIDQYIDQLVNQGSQVKNQSFRQKTDQLLAILRAIKKSIQEDPGRIEDLNKFVDYYTPTSIKLIDRYLEFEQSPIPLDSMNKSMHDIEKSIETLIVAYENLLNDLYREDLLDLSAEMKVMNTVLTQDGLIKPEK